MHWKWTTTWGTVVLTLPGRNYITCRHIITAAGTELSSVSCGQGKSKDMPFSDDWYNAFVMVVNK